MVSAEHRKVKQTHSVICISLHGGGWDRAKGGVRESRRWWKREGYRSRESDGKKKRARDSNLIKIKCKKDRAMIKILVM